MRVNKLIISAVLAAVLLSGCAEPPELAAAKKISRNVAQARELLKDRTSASNQRAAKLLQEALLVPGATQISKQSAHELLGALLCQAVASELTPLADLQRGFVQADTDLRHSLSELATKVAGLGYVVGLANLDDQKLQQSRQQLLAKIPPAQQDRDAAQQARIALEQKLAATKRQATAAAIAADQRLLKAEEAAGQQHVQMVAQGADMRVEADILLIRARNEELELLTAKEDEIRRISELLALQQSLRRVEQLLSDHADRAAQTAEANRRAQAAAEESAEKLLSTLEKFAVQGTKLSTKYEELIKQQQQAAQHFAQALAGAKDRSQKFREFQTKRPPKAPPDLRADMLVPLDTEIALAVSQAQAHMTTAELQQQSVLALKRLRTRAWQVEQVRADLTGTGTIEPLPQIRPSLPAPGSTIPAAPTESFGIFKRLLTQPEKEMPDTPDKREQPQPQPKRLTAVRIVMDAPRTNTGIVEQTIQQTHEAALQNYDSAISSLWSTALPRMGKEGSTEEMINGLKNAEWNWQVWGMLGLAHQGRAALAEQMNRTELANTDRQAADNYLEKAGEARKGLVRADGPK